MTQNKVLQYTKRIKKLTEALENSKTFSIHNLNPIKLKNMFLSNFENLVAIDQIRSQDSDAVCFELKISADVHTLIVILTENFDDTGVKVRLANAVQRTTSYSALTVGTAYDYGEIVDLVRLNQQYVDTTEATYYDTRAVFKRKVDEALSCLEPDTYEINEARDIIWFLGKTIQDRVHNTQLARKSLNSYGYDLKPHRQAGNTMPASTCSIVKIADAQNLNESSAGIELYTDKGALKAKVLGTKVTSSKTTNKLSDLETKSDIKDLNPSQKQAVKGVISALKSKNKLKDISTDFNTSPDVVFKANGDAVIYPDSGKASYRLPAKDIEKFEENRKRNLKENALMDENDTQFTPLYEINPSTRAAKVCERIVDQLVDALEIPMDENGCSTHWVKDTVSISDKVAGNQIIDIKVGFIGTHGPWAVRVEYIGLEPADIYDIVETPVQEIVESILSTAIPE